MMKLEEKTLESVLKYEKEHNCEDGAFGMRECKRSIKSDLELGVWDDRIKDVIRKPTLYTLLELFMYRAKTEVTFNDRMVLACWELINNRD